MFKKINFESLLQEMKDNDDFNDIIEDLSEEDKNFFLQQFRAGFYDLLNNSTISPQKFYNDMKILLKIESKMDTDENGNK